MYISRIAIVSIPVKDIEAAKTFYTEKLGFVVVRDTPMGEMRWVEVVPAGAATTIVLVNWFPHMPTGSVHGLVLDTSDVAADYETLKSRGLNVTPLETAPWGKFTTFNDPDGNGWVLQQAAF